eukprot:TRINITY_DN2905_c0_g1_i2.p1 TRINITY_DN2905_c0_g1~~TRINITY_DN2905_c0_g1_i2.p1  ORF type:complete len:197 (+),score=54.26 TRINITY_DN2905_c0_g1_i2:89-679(+)
MELSGDVTRGVEQLADPKRFSDAAYQALVKIVFDVILQKKTEDALWENEVLNGLDKILVKQGYASLVSIIIEFSKLGSETSEIQEYLNEQSLPENRVQLFLDTYTENKSSLKALISTTGFHFPHVLDVNWRVDYLIKSSLLEKVNTPSFFIKLLTKGDEENNNEVQFTCTLEQMQDLVAQLKDATASLERLDMFSQ